jgi:hypothetical protein
MAIEVRYAVRRDEKRTKSCPTPRSLWWHWKPQEEFEEDWHDRKLFERKASALAVIWEYRDQDYQNHYTFVLVKVTRKSSSHLSP